MFKFLHLSCVLLLNSWVRSSRTNHLEPILNDLKICTEESFPMPHILWRLVPPFHVPLYFFWSKTSFLFQFEQEIPLLSIEGRLVVVQASQMLLEICCLHGVTQCLWIANKVLLFHTATGLICFLVACSTHCYYPKGSHIFQSICLIVCQTTTQVSFQQFWHCSNCGLLSSGFVYPCSVIGNGLLQYHKWCCHLCSL